MNLVNDVRAQVLQADGPRHSLDDLPGGLKTRAPDALVDLFDIASINPNNAGQLEWNLYLHGLSI